VREIVQNATVDCNTYLAAGGITVTFLQHTPGLACAGEGFKGQIIDKPKSVAPFSGSGWG